MIIQMTLYQSLIDMTTTLYKGNIKSTSNNTKLIVWNPKMTTALKETSTKNAKLNPLHVREYNV